MWLYIITIFLVLIFLQYYRFYKIDKLSQITGWIPLPFLGNVLSFVNGSDEDMWTTFLDLAKKYENARIYKFESPVFLLSNPDDCKIILNSKSSINKSYLGYDEVKKSFKSGIFLSEYEKWKVRRKLVIPAFTPEIINQYMESIIERTEIFFDQIKSQGDVKIQDLKYMNHMFAFMINSQTMFGINDVGSLFSTEYIKKFLSAFHSYMDTLFYRMWRPYITDWMLPFLSVGRKQLRAFTIISNVSDKIILEGRKINQEQTYSYKKSVGNMDDENKFEGNQRKSGLFDLLLSAEKKGLIDKEGIEEEILTFLLAGYESVGNALTFSLMLLAENKEIQDTARNEVNKIFYETNGKLTVDNLKKLTYVERCIKESLRLFPPGVLIGRRTKGEIQLTKGRIPADADVILHVYAVQRNSKYWPDPDKFDPDRFLPEQAQNRHPYVYLPFSGGSRNCMGYKFAMPWLKCTVAHILYNFYIEPIDRISDIKLTLHTPLVIRQPTRARFIKINHY